MAAERPPIHFGPYTLDRVGGRLMRDGAGVAIAPRTLAVLEFLASRPGALVCKDELLDGVWGHRFVSESVLKVAINDLRSALGDNAGSPRWVHTVPRRGYRFSSDIGPAGPAPGRFAGPGNLPHVAGPLIGRDADLARLREALDQHRLVTLTGPGGVGKTRLALAAAGHAAPVDGVWLMRLDALAASDPITPALTRALGFADAAGADEHSLGRALQPLRLRLVLDNAEHLVESLAPPIAHWLQQAPALQILVTSQRPLRLPGEHVLAVPPLALPQPDAAGTLPRDPSVLQANAAVALLVLRGQAQQPDWQPAGAEWEDLADIARSLDGLPLALELAAARIALLGTAGVRKRLGARLQMLTRGAADAPDRHRTLRAALAWSVALLPAPVARLLELCAVFAGSFTLGAVQAVAAVALPDQDEWTVLDGMDQLRELALVADTGTPIHPLAPPPGSAAAAEVPLDWRPPPRLRLYDSVALLGRERLAARGAAAAAHSGHLHWLRSSFERADAQQLDLSEAVWLARLEPEAANLQAGMARILADLDADPGHSRLLEATELFVASMAFALRSGMRQQAVAWSQVLHTRLASADVPPLPTLLQARLDLAKATLGAVALLPQAEGLASAERAEVLLRQLGERRRLLLLLFMKGLLELRLVGLAAAQADLAAMRRLVGPTPTVYERRLPSWLEAMVARELGDLDGYRRFWAEMLAESEARGDRLEAWKAAWGLGQTLFLQNRFQEAAAVMDAAVDEMRRTQRLRANTLLVAQAASMRLALDAGTETLVRVREAVQLLRSEGLVSYSLADALPWAAWWQGRHADALRLQRWADEVAVQRGERRGPVSDLLRASFMARQSEGAQTHALPATSELDDDGALRLSLGPG